MKSLLPVDKQLPTPAYLQLREQLSKAIYSGAFQPGTALPSERELAATLALSRMTVRRAFTELVEAGLVQQRQGSGTYVRAAPVEQTIDRLMGFSEEAAQLGIRPGSRTLEASPFPADSQVATALGVSAGTHLLRLVRLRTADEQPLALQIAFLSPALADLSLELVQQLGSLYRAVAAQFQIEPFRARQRISARLPSANEQQLLELAQDEPVLALERTTFDSAGKAFEFVRSAYRGDRYRVALDLRAAVSASV